MVVCYIRNDKRWGCEKEEYLVKLFKINLDNLNKNFLNWQDRQSFLLGRLLLMYLLKKLGIRKANSSIQYNVFGKPFFENGPYFNLSHSGDFVVCCVNSEGNVGIDIEECSDVIEEELFKTICTEDEFHLAESQGLPLSMFYKIWTQKEAVLKAYGKGLSVPMNQFNVQGVSTILEGKTWYLHEIAIAHGYQCHLASEKLILSSICTDLILIEELISFLSK